MDVGFIGLGDQGAPMARAIAEAGFALHVWARRPASLATLDGVPHQVETSIKGLAEGCDLVGVCVGDDRDIEEVLITNGLVRSVRSGGVVAIHSTISPETSQRMAAAGDKAGVAVIDAPVSGGGAAAREKRLATILGGDPAACERARPVFESFSATVTRVGGPGAGQLTKLINNSLLLANLRNVADVLADATDLGLDLPVLIEVLQASSGASTALKTLHEAMSPALLDHHTQLLSKDLDAYLAAANALGLTSPRTAEAARAGLAGLPEALALPGACRAASAAKEG